MTKLEKDYSNENVIVKTATTLAEGKELTEQGNIEIAYGRQSVGRIRFYHVDTNELVGVIDTATETTRATESTEVTANGGEGNKKLITWSTGKDITGTIASQVLSKQIKSLLSGNKIEYVEQLINHTESLDKVEGKLTLKVKTVEADTLKVYPIVRGTPQLNMPTEKLTVEDGVITLGQEDKYKKYFVEYKTKDTVPTVHETSSTSNPTFNAEIDYICTTVENSGDEDQFIERLIQKVTITKVEDSGGSATDVTGNTIEYTVMPTDEGDKSVFTKSILIGYKELVERVNKDSQDA